MTGPLYAIGRFCSRHHYPVIAAWVALAIALVLAGQAGRSRPSERLTLRGTDSTVATELLEDNLPEQAYGSNPLVMEAPRGGTLTEPKYSAAVAETVKRLEALPDVNSAVSPLSPEGANFLSKDRTIGYIPVVLGLGPGEIDEEQAGRILDSAQPARAAGLRTGERRRRGRLRRLHRRDRPLLARLRRDPAGQHARLHGGDRRGRRRLRRGDAAAGDAGSARAQHQLAADQARQDPPRRFRAPWLAALGRRGRGTALALGDRCPGGTCRAGAADLPARAWPERHQRAAKGHDLASGLRQPQQGLRAGGQRAAADRFGIQVAGRSETGAAGAPESHRRRRRRRRGDRTDPRQDGDGDGLHRDLQIGALG